MTNNTIRVNYENCKSAQYELETSNIRHINKIIECLADATYCLSGTALTGHIVSELNEAITTLEYEKKRYNNLVPPFCDFQNEVANANQLIEDQISKIFNENYTNKSPMQMENTVDSYYEQCSMFALENENFSPAELVILSQLTELIKTCKSPKELQVEIEKLKATNKSDTEYTKIMNSIIDENFGSASKTGLTVAGIVKDAMSKYIEKKYPEMSAAEIIAIQKKITKLSFNLEKQSLKINEYTKLNGKTYQKYFSILNKRNIQEGIINDYYTGLEYKDNIDKLSKGIIAVQIGTELYKDIGVNGMDLEDITQDMAVTGGSIAAGAAGSGIAVGLLSLASIPVTGPIGAVASLVGCFGGGYLYNQYLSQPIQDKLDDTQDWWEEFQWQE